MDLRPIINDPAWKKLKEEIMEADLRDRQEAMWKIYGKPMGAEPARRKGVEQLTLKRKKETEATVKMSGSKADVSRRKTEAHQQAEEVASDYELEEGDCSDSEFEAVQAGMFRDKWIALWSGSFGSFDDTTPIPPMRYTDEPAPDDSACHMHTLQIFSVKVAEITGGLQWPLDVFGIVAARDTLDHNRNIIFSRSRDNCQTITQEDPYLELTGPTRAIVVLDPVTFEVVLKVKGITESENKDLSILVVPHNLDSTETRLCVINSVHTRRLSTLELTFGHIVKSVEATISVRVIGGSWPDGFRGVFTANTVSIDHMEVSLLAFGDNKFPVDADGKIVLSRRVACVERNGELKVSVVAQCENEEEAVESDYKVFKPMGAGRSRDTLKVDSCEMEVTVAWSLFSHYQFVRGVWAGASRIPSPSEFIYEGFAFA